ncbi:MAG: glycosyltransferase family 39 protein [Pirellulales bacterium]
MARTRPQPSLPTKASTNVSPAPRAERKEWALAGVIFLLGIMVRVAFPSHWGIDHFDEGVYSSHLPPGPQGHGPYPLLHLYAPPLVPTLLDWAQRLFPECKSPEIAAGIVCGCLTLPLVWWITRSWFGPVAGLVALALAATSDVHALFSRTALTDPWLLLLLLLAVFFLERAVRTGGLVDVVASGLLTGIAWWTKYNGWLPLAIGATAIALRVLATKQWDQRQAAASWLGVAAIAGILFAAQLQLLQGDGYRYADISANHARYVVGLTGWPESLHHQYANLRWLDGALSRVVGPLLMGLVATLGPLVSRRRWLGLVITTVIGAAFALAGAISILPCLAILPLASTIGSWWRSGRHPTWPECFLAAWLAGLSFATPNYHPYTRLTLPWLAACWIAAGWSVSQIVEWFATDSPPPILRKLAKFLAHRPRPTALAAMALFVISCAIVLPYLRIIGVPAWRDRGDLQRASLALYETAAATLGAEATTIFLTYGEPAVYHALSRDERLHDWERRALAPVADIPTRNLDSPTFVITGPHSRYDSSLERWLNPNAADSAIRLELIASKAFAPSDVTWLDLTDPRQFAGVRNQRQMELRCYRVRPPSASR